MKASKFSDAQKAFILKQGHDGVAVAEICSKAGISQAANIAIIERVMLMTPENIHLNSFMYEPIIDMSDDHLRRL